MALAAFEVGCLLLPHWTKLPIGRNRQTCENYSSDEKNRKKLHYDKINLGTPAP